MQSTELDNCIKKVDPHLQDDLKAELALALLETDAEYVCFLSHTNRLKFYSVRILLNLTSSTGPFYKKYRYSAKDIDNEVHKEDDYNSILHRKTVEEKALSEVDKLDWYESEMVKLYLDVGNYRDMQKATRIPYVSCFNTVKTAVKRIKSRL